MYKNIFEPIVISMKGEQCCIQVGLKKYLWQNKASCLIKYQ